jgi:hypothetical protein
MTEATHNADAVRALGSRTQALSQVRSGSLGAQAFSQTDLLDSLQLWLDKAGLQLARS